MSVARSSNKTITINGIEFRKYYACDAHGTEVSNFWVDGVLVPRMLFFESLDAQLIGWTKIR